MSPLNKEDIPLYDKYGAAAHGACPYLNEYSGYPLNTSIRHREHLRYHARRITL